MLEAAIFVVFPFCMLYAAISDILSMTIANRVSILLVASFAIIAPFTGMEWSLYGMHFVVAAILATIMQGNILAALLATFFGNPLTYVPIGVIALKTGHWLLGNEFDPEHASRSLGGKFADAGHDLWYNIKTPFTGNTPDWEGLRVFYDDVFFPYMIGGIIPGIIAATIAYYLAVPLIQAYQNRRRGRIKAKFEALKAKRAAAKAKDKAHDHTPGE